MNPFDAIVHLYRFIVHTALHDVMMLIMSVWEIAAQLLMVWMVFALVLPSINFIDHLYWLFEMVIITPSAAMFYFFADIAETIRTIPPAGMNPLERAIKFIGFIGFTGLSLVIAPFFWFGCILAGYFGFINLLSGKMQQSIVGSSTRSTGNNLKYMLMGVVSVNEQLEARVQANEIKNVFGK